MFTPLGPPPPPRPACCDITLGTGARHCGHEYLRASHVLVQGWQCEWPHGSVMGSARRSLQMQHVNMSMAASSRQTQCSSA
jgi:hypothetical protein